MLNNEQQTTLEKIIKTGSVEKLREFVAVHPDVDLSTAEIDKHQRTALMLAAGYGHIELMVFLLTEIKVNPAVEDKRENAYTAMRWAVQADRKESVDLLLAQSLNQTDISYAFIYFAEKNKLDELKNLMQRYTFTPADKGKALLAALKEKHSDVYTFLLTQAGEINVNESNYMHEHALLIAIMEGCKDAVDMLLKRTDVNLHHQGYLAGTALTYAVYLEDQALITRLISKEKKQYGTFDSSQHPGVLNIPIRANNIDIVKLILEADPNIEKNINLPGNFSNIARPDWVWRRMEKFEEAYPTDESFNENLPLIEAVLKENYAMVLLLMANGADCFVENYKGQTPQQLAARSTNARIVDLISSVAQNQNSHALFLYSSGYGASKESKFVVPSASGSSKISLKERPESEIYTTQNSLESLKTDLLKILGKHGLPEDIKTLSQVVNTLQDKVAKPADSPKFSKLDI